MLIKSYGDFLDPEFHIYLDDILSRPMGGPLDLPHACHYDL